MNGKWCFRGGIWRNNADVLDERKVLQSAWGEASRAGWPEDWRFRVQETSAKQDAGIMGTLLLSTYINETSYACPNLSILLSSGESPCWCERHHGNLDDSKF